MLALVLYVLTLQPQLIPLDRLTVEQARTLNGKRITVTFLVTKPIDLWRGLTIIGAEDLPDGTERGAHFIGRRLDIDAGQRVTVTGRLRVIDHAPAYLNQKFVPAWSEIRIEEGK